MRPEIEGVIDELQSVIVGKREVIEKLLLCVLAGGHALIDDVPGVGKTTMAVTLSKALGLEYRRIQFTPDVLPSDITGFSVYDKESGGLKYMAGAAIGTNILLGDEINRTSSKTQSALLEAMEERQVTVDGQTYSLLSPFIVIATQNNIGTAGTQLLPFAQLDRFLMRLAVGYPDFDGQMAIIRDRQRHNPADKVRGILSVEDVLRMQSQVLEVTLKDSVIGYITRLVMASRETEALELGISPRGALFVSRAARALAYARGRDYTIPEDVRRVFCDVCAHRVIPAKAEQAPSEGILAGLLREVKPPDSV